MNYLQLANLLADLPDPRRVAYDYVYAEPAVDSHGLPHTKYVFQPRIMPYVGPGHYIGYIVRSTGQFTRGPPPRLDFPNVADYRDIMRQTLTAASTARFIDALERGDNLLQPLDYRVAARFAPENFSFPPPEINPRGFVPE